MHFWIALDTEQVYHEYKDNLFTEKDLSSGYAMINSKREKTNGEEKSITRILDKRLIFISSHKSSLLYTNESKINSLCEKYKKNENDFFSGNNLETVKKTLNSFRRSSDIRLND